MGVSIKANTGAARLAFETGCPIVTGCYHTAPEELQKPGQVIPDKGKTMVIYGKPIEVEKNRWTRSRMTTCVRLPTV